MFKRVKCVLFWCVTLCSSVDTPQCGLWSPSACKVLYLRPGPQDWDRTLPEKHVCLSTRLHAVTCCVVPRVVIRLSLRKADFDSQASPCGMCVVDKVALGFVSWLSGVGVTASLLRASILFLSVSLYSRSRWQRRLIRHFLGVTLQKAVRSSDIRFRICFPCIIKCLVARCLLARLRNPQQELIQQR